MRSRNVRKRVTRIRERSALTSEISNASADVVLHRVERDPEKLEVAAERKKRLQAYKAARDSAK